MDKSVLLQNDSFLGSNLKDCTVLISGATGLIGSHIVQYLDHLNKTANAGIRIIMLDINAAAYQKIADGLYDPSACTFVECDLEQGAPIDENVDYIIHCAGFSGGSKMHLKNPLKVFDTGINGTRKLLDYAVSHNCKGFLYVSTYEVYGDSSCEERIPETQACNLDTFELRNCYAEIKRLCESMLCAFSKQYGLNVYAARLTSTFGSGVRYNDPRFFAEFARCVIENRDIVLKSQGATVRGYLDADDAVTAFLYILLNGESCNAYNLTNPNNEISIRDIAESVIALSGTSSKVVFDIAEDTAKLGMRKEGKTVMDASKLLSIGWKPAYSMDDTLQKLIESMKKDKASE